MTSPVYRVANCIKEHVYVSEETQYADSENEGGYRLSTRGLQGKLDLASGRSELLQVHVCS